MPICKQNHSIQILKPTAPPAQMQWLMRILVTANTSTSGFVLPTVAMVSLVIVLLTTAIMIRSFDRSRYASNLRVNETVLNAATPALERARTKIDALMADSSLPPATPTDVNLDKALNNNKYTLGDETRLRLVNSNNYSNNFGENQDTLTTAWKFPVDSDNNGKFDSYTLYGIYLRSPNAKESRNPLAARTPPMQGDVLGKECEHIASGSDRAAGDSGWYPAGDKLSKSFFVYTATVPITNPPINAVNYEAHKGNKSFYALEFQQDRSRIPLRNHTAYFQNDLELTPKSTFNLNGKIATNGNLLIGSTNNQATRLFQVSNQYSCFYNQENSKIAVGGNVGLGNVADNRNRTGVSVDLFNGFGKEPITATLDGSNKSTTSEGGAQVGYNDAAYNQRIALMKQTALSFHPNYDTRNNIDAIPPTRESVASVREYPSEVKAGFASAIADNFNTRGSSLYTWEVLGDQIETYLKNRTRRVPFAEVARFDRTSAIDTYDFDGDGVDVTVFERGTIIPPAKWREPTDASARLLTDTNITLDPNNLPQTQPEKQLQAGKETYLGDRINVGNNLPAYWKKVENLFLGFTEKQFINGINWLNPNNQPRYRTTQVTPLPNQKIAQRNGFWENSAARQFPTTAAHTVGMRIITGAGIYVDNDRSNSFLPKPELNPKVTEPPAFRTRNVTTGNENIIVWSDALPMTGRPENSNNKLGDLQMRATAVYYYKNAYTNPDYIERTPTACVSSYYDPTDATTAKNKLNIDGGYGVDINNGRSNNGIVYPPPFEDIGSREAAVRQYRDKLNLQARLIFPNGRVVNQPLGDALEKIDAGTTRSLADNSAIDTAICAMRILDGTLAPSSNPVIPHRAIKEAAFLDAREVKAIDKTATNYDLELENRQPLEVRVTDVNLGLLAATKIGEQTNPQEYLLPNSGIIYASRDDALADESDRNSTQLPGEQTQLISPTDFQLDATRRPNGIRLINGSNLAREDDYREAEFGLIFATNLPAYVKGDFNLHQQPITRTPTEEFLDKLLPNWNNFYTRNANFDTNFACRRGQNGCGDRGDQWRSATIISDATTILSNNFVDGFRNDGDYDLNNHLGEVAAAKRKQNGFFENSFVTSVNWVENNSPFPPDKSSYLTNGVTPIQRRTQFPEYVMEMCRNLVSECKQSDWVVGYDRNEDGFLDDAERNVKSAEVLQDAAKVSQLGAGTTARFALQPEDRRYPRRVAFVRDQNSGNLSYQTSTKANADDNQVTPTPLGINDNNLVAQFPYSDSGNTGVPKLADNALWFRTTSNTNGTPFCSGNNNPAGFGCTSDDRSYTNNQPLYLENITRPYSPETASIPNVESLNSPTDNPASGYTVCTNSGASKRKTITEDTKLEFGRCGNISGNPQAVVEETIRDLIDLQPNDNDVVNAEESFTGSRKFDPGETTTYTAQGRVNIVNLGNSTLTLETSDKQETTIKLEGTSDSIFIFKLTAGDLKFADSRDCEKSCNRRGIAVNLQGVDPNNVFWVIGGNVEWNEVDTKYEHNIRGNFLVERNISRMRNVQLEGRILGANSLPNNKSGNFQESTINAIASNAQPALVPVLQIYSPEGSPGSNTLNQGNADIQDNWLQTAKDTTVNAVFVSGNSPSRPQEESAGLPNFIRLLENWKNKTLNIKGSFIQLQRSAYATAPFATIVNFKAGVNDGSLSLFGYDFTQYKTSNGVRGTLPYFSEPNRQWSFDVGLLSQAPDLFAQQFTQPVTTPTNEFYREVERDDPWVQTLLCATEKSGNSYTYAIDENERPQCTATIDDHNL